MEKVSQISLELLQGQQTSSAEPVEESRDTSQSNACPICNGLGWQKVVTNEFVGMRRCECVGLRTKELRLAEIPKKFRAATFDSYEPKNPQQMRTRGLMVGQPERSYFICGSYGNGKTHLLVAQYRTAVLLGIPCHFRVSDELMDELQRETWDKGFVSPVMEAIRTKKRYHLFWDDIEKIKSSEYRDEQIFRLVNAIYNKELSLSVTSNLSIEELANLPQGKEKVPQAVVRRIDDICRMVGV